MKYNKEDLINEIKNLINNRDFYFASQKLYQLSRKYPESEELYSLQGLVFYHYQKYNLAIEYLTISLSLKYNSKTAFNLSII